MQLNQAIHHYLDPVLKEKGYELVSIQHQKHARHGVKITLFIDRLDGINVTVDDCAAVTRIAQAQFETLLEDYLLEVSSPGIDRAISTPEHFQRFKNRAVKLTLKDPIQDQKVWKGIIEAANEIEVGLRISGIDELFSVAYNNIQK